MTPGQSVVSGGRVKLLALEKEFPGSEQEFNILYLVSSALPKAPAAWIDRAHSIGAKVVWNQNGIGYPGWAGTGYERTNQNFKRLVSTVDHVLFQSEFCKSSYKEFVGEPPDEHRVLYNSIDTEVFKPVEQPIQKRPLRLLMAGTASAPYRVRVGLETLAHVLQRGVDAQLILSGVLDFENGPEETERLTRSMDLESHVCVTGPYTRNQAPAVFQSAHILVHPKYKDPCPTVVVEAMASGLPVVASSSGGLRELLGEKGGSLVESEESWETIHPPDPKRMCDEVLKIDADLDRRSTQARSRAVEHFSERSWLDTQRTLFSQLLGHTSEGP